MNDEHMRSRWFTVGNPFFGREYSLGCTCGWRSAFTRLHYEAELALQTHIATQERLGVCGDH